MTVTTPSLSGLPSTGPRTPRRILFGWKPDWEPILRARLDHDIYPPTFAQLTDTDLTKFDCVVPLTLADYDALAANPSRAFAAVLCPNPETVALCHDKGRFNDYLLNNGFATLVPQLYTLEKPRNYPIVLKPRRGAWGKGVRILHGPDDDQVLPDESNWLRQAYVPGRVECVAHILAIEGEIRFASGLECTTGQEFRINGQGWPVRYNPAEDAAALVHLGAVLHRLRYTGTACFDYKWAEGRPMIFEMNPRVGYSLLLHGLNSYLTALLGALGRG